MLPTLLSLAGVLIAGLAIVIAVFVGGLRAKWPPVVDAIRRMNRTLNKGQIERSGQPGAFAGVIHHVGRSSGKEYATPLTIVAYGDDFLIAIVYGRRSDWLQNVMAAGTATIDFEGESYDVDQPQIVPMTEVSEAFSSSDQVYQRVLAIDEALLLHRADDAVEPASDVG